MYVLDLRNDIERFLLNKKDNVVFIQGKDINRIGLSNRVLAERQVPINDIPVSYETLTPFYYRLYDYIGNDSLFAYSFKKDTDVFVKEWNDAVSYKEIRHYHTNKKNGYYSIFYHPRVNPPLLRKDHRIDDSDLRAIVDRGILKAYDPQFDIYVFQIQNKLVWLIGSPIKIGTKVLYHIYPDSNQMLPEKQRPYGFDNRDFIVRSEKDIKKCDKYIIFEKKFPVEYRVTKIRVGFNTDSIVTWQRLFSVANY